MTVHDVTLEREKRVYVTFEEVKTVGALEGLGVREQQADYNKMAPDKSEPEI